MLTCTQLFQYIFLLSLTLTPCRALPPLPAPIFSPFLFIRRDEDFVINNNTGTVQVFDPSTQETIPQATATDGGGNGFDAPAILWLVFALLVGLPMALAGFRGRKATTGTGFGLAFAVCSWAALVNGLKGGGVSDALLTAVVLVLFVIGFGIGLWKFSQIVGITFVGALGGLAVGVRVMIFRENLVLQQQELFPVVWVLIGVCGLAGGLVMLWWQRAGILFGCASIGTFLTFLGIDLIVNKQEGMSRGLRYLFDRNTTHVADLIVKGYTPSVSTQVLLGISLGLTPALAYMQHKVFKAPFNPQSFLDSETEEALNAVFNNANNPDHLEKGRHSFFASKSKLRSRFSL
ncbi:hypothetical protein AX16_004478 [Volvariella volvacea WC 439]|nr:hypothetical protein AX16_004478 [Volvariella volvacea WC 439]